jgi:hypothetical protein
LFAFESGPLPLIEQHRTWPDCEDAAMRWRMERPNTLVVCLPASVLADEGADGVTGKAKVKAKVKQRP